MYFNRILQINLPQGQSAFLWGARKTGKSSFLKHTFPTAVSYDLLNTDLLLAFSTTPSRLREEVLALPTEALSQPIILDEIQKVPLLLNEVHWLIEHTNAQFILCGSSARKLKKSVEANLLGGRAWRYSFYPLVYKEIPNFSLLKTLNNGLIPSHYLAAQPKKSLKSYVNDYLIQEVQAEGYARNLPAFHRFMDAIAYSNGEMVNYANMARDCGVSEKTAKEYTQILVDTLLGYFIYPFQQRSKRSDLITQTPKFYFFDLGIVNIIQKQWIAELKGSRAGTLFEQFILMELIAYRGIFDLDFDICYWRTKTGKEIDFILGKGEVAIEVKLNDNFKPSDLSFDNFSQTKVPRICLVVTQCARARQIEIQGIKVQILPWQDFLSKLWEHQIINE